MPRVTRSTRVAQTCLERAALAREVQVLGRKYPQKLAQGGHPVFVGGMKPTPIRIVLTDSERQELEKRARSLTAPHREVLRAKVVLGWRHASH